MREPSNPDNRNEQVPILPYEIRLDTFGITEREKESSISDFFNLIKYYKDHKSNSYNKIVINEFINKILNCNYSEQDLEFLEQVLNKLFKERGDAIDKNNKRGVFDFYLNNGSNIEENFKRIVSKGLFAILDIIKEYLPKEQWKSLYINFALKGEGCYFNICKYGLSTEYRIEALSDLVSRNKYEAIKWIFKNETKELFKEKSEYIQKLFIEKNLDFDNPIIMEHLGLCKRYEKQPIEERNQFRKKLNDQRSTPLKRSTDK
jgi:hypothetical protein